MKKIKYVILFCLSIAFIPNCSFASNIGLSVEVFSKSSGRAQAGVEVKIVDVWGYFDYVHKRNKFTESNGKVFFGAVDLRGFTMKNGQTWNPGPYQEKLGGRKLLKIKISVEGKTRYIELREEKKYTVTIEI